MDFSKIFIIYPFLLTIAYGNMVAMEASFQKMLISHQDEKKEISDFDEVDEKGNTQLHRAAAAGNYEQVRNLVYAGAGIEGLNEDDKTPTQLAYEANHVEVNNFLVAHLYILFGAEDRDVAQVKQALEEFKVFIDVRTHDGDTALHIASLYGCMPIVQLLINKGAFIAARNNRQDTPLHHAACFNQPAVVDFLIQHKAPVNAKNNVGQTPLHYAALFGHKEIVQKLLVAGANKNQHDNVGMIPVDCAQDRMQRIRDGEDCELGVGAEENLTAIIEMLSV